MAGDRQVASQMQGRTISSRGLTAVGVFLFFGATMACLAGTTLTWPGTVLDRAWRLNPAAYEQLAGYGRILGVAFFALSAVLTLAGIGWFQRRRWGWLLAVAIIATQLLGDGVNLFAATSCGYCRHDRRGGVAVLPTAPRYAGLSLRTCRESAILLNFAMLPAWVGRGLECNILKWFGCAADHHVRRKGGRYDGFATHHVENTCRSCRISCRWTAPLFVAGWE